MALFSFGEQKKLLDATTHMRRIVDLSTPRLRHDDKRVDKRYNRGLPVAICPWWKGQPDISEVVLCMTRDLSDKGISVITTAELVYEEVVFTILLDSETSTDLCFFQATMVRQNRFFGFGEYGLRVNEYLNVSHRRLIRPFLELLTNPEVDAAVAIQRGAV